MYAPYVGDPPRAALLGGVVPDSPPTLAVLHAGEDQWRIVPCASTAELK
ncbi:MAG TPA: hypothetical protein VNG93_05040 [Candidatus Dormibacteraeota bacterium]|nr:hypothetical protein [Candidatus Dormibacteraeota bacterium]